VDLGRIVEQRLHHPPGLLDAVLPREALAVADQRGMEEHLVWRRALTALLGELHVQVDSLGPHRVGTLSIDHQPYAGRRVELDDQLVGLRALLPSGEPDPGRLLEDEPQLGLGDR
jgi:hypothetical protein